MLSLCKFSAAFSCQNGDSRHVRAVYTRLERYSPLKGYIREDGGGENGVPSAVSTVPRRIILAEPSRTYLINPLTTRIEASRKDLRSRADNVRHALTSHSTSVKWFARRYECGRGEAISPSSNISPSEEFSDYRLDRRQVLQHFSAICPWQLPYFLSRETFRPGKISLLINSEDSDLDKSRSIIELLYSSLTVVTGSGRDRAWTNRNYRDTCFKTHTFPRARKKLAYRNSIVSGTVPATRFIEFFFARFLPFDQPTSRNISRLARVSKF